MTLAVLAATQPVSYTAGQAFSDLAQIAPIAAVAVALVVAVVVDLLLPSRLRGPVVMAIAALGLVVAFAIALARWLGGGGQSAYFGFVTGDNFALFFEMLFAVLGLMTLAVAHAYVRRRGLQEAELHVLTLAALVGMMSLAAATSLVTVFLALETLSLALYVSCGYTRRETTAQEAAAKYLLIGGFASAFLLYGMALVYGASGSTLLADINKAVTSAQASNPILILGVLMLGVGFGFKISGAPFHQWTPDVYQGAPLPVTAFMSVGTKAAAFAMIIRVFSYGLANLASEWQIVLAFIAVLSMIVGNLGAIVQSSVKRLLAYSGIAQGGYMLVGVIAGGRDGVAAVLFYLAAYVFMNFGAFAVLTALVDRDAEHDSMKDLTGLGYRQQLLGILMTVFMFSLAGFPPLVGFIGKFFLFRAAVASGWTWLVVIAVLASVVSVAYYLRVVYHVWSPAAEGERQLARERGALASVLISGALALLLGLFPTLILVAGLTGAGPVLLTAGR
jgi:NADH-quinone oxidoreductase subunit N